MCIRDSLYADLRSVTGEARTQTFARLLEFTSLGTFTGRLAGKLSGGMKQKLGLACTLVGAVSYTHLPQQPWLRLSRPTC